MAEAGASRLERLLGFIRTDPTNLNLIADATAAALDEGRPDEASKLVDLYSQHAPLPPTLVNLAGLAAMQEQRFADAIAIFDSLVAGRSEDGILKFNLAWACFMQGQADRAADLIDETVVQAAPQAAAVKVQALHMAGRLEEALEWGERAAQRAPEDQPLLGALAVVAMDLDKPDLARTYSKRAGSTVDGLSTLGALELGEGKIDRAEQLFEEALRGRHNSARALIGKGLVLMARNEPGAAAEWLHKGASVFDDHLGSWIAAGWAEFAAGDYGRSRQTFQHALDLDDTFAESHGALAVLDVVAGDLESAARRSDVALRLDRQCFSAVLAKSLMEDRSGREAAGQRIREQALRTPVGPNGQTLADAIAALTRRAR